MEKILKEAVGGPVYSGPIKATTSLGNITCDWDTTVQTPHGPYEVGVGGCHN